MKRWWKERYPPPTATKDILNSARQGPMCVPQDDSGARGPLGSENAGGVAVEVLPRPVVAHGYARVGVARGDATTSAAPMRAAGVKRACGVVPATLSGSAGWGARFLV